MSQVKMDNLVSFIIDNLGLHSFNVDYALIDGDGMQWAGQSALDFEYTVTSQKKTSSRIWIQRKNCHVFEKSQLICILL